MNRRYICRSCGKSIYLVYNKHDLGVRLFAEEIEHNHGQEQVRSRLPVESVKRVQELFEEFSNRDILRKLQEENLPPLTDQQLRNLKSRLNKHK